MLRGSSWSESKGQTIIIIIIINIAKTSKLCFEQDFAEAQTQNINVNV